MMLCWYDFVMKNNCNSCLVLSESPLSVIVAVFLTFLEGFIVNLSSCFAFQLYCLIVLKFSYNFDLRSLKIIFAAGYLPATA